MTNEIPYILLLDYTALVLIARFASNYLTSNTHNEPFSIPVYEALAEYLMQKNEE